MSLFISDLFKFFFPFTYPLYIPNKIETINRVRHYDCTLLFDILLLPTRSARSRDFRENMRLAISRHNKEDFISGLVGRGGNIETTILAELHLFGSYLYTYTSRVRSRDRNRNHSGTQPAPRDEAVSRALDSKHQASTRRSGADRPGDSERGRR